MSPLCCAFLLLAWLPAFALRFWLASDLLGVGFLIIQKLDPNSEIVVWSDMFDSFHNAGDNYW